MAPRIAIGTWAFGVFEDSAESFDTVLQGVRECGYTGIELGAFAPHPNPESHSTYESRTKLQGEIDGHRLGLAGVAASFNCRSVLRSDDPSVFLDVLERNLQFTADVGGTRLVINTGDSPTAPEEIGEDLAFERLVAAWTVARARAIERGITLAWEFEPCWAFSRPEQIIAVAETLCGPGFGVLYDTAHAHVCVDGYPGGQEALLERLAGRIAHIHLLDSDGRLHMGSQDTAPTTMHVPFGQGNIDFDRVTQALVRAGCADLSWWTVDLCFWLSPWEAAVECRKFVEQLICDHVS